jgi:deoxyadenosine/deoxycytidine kinase
MLKIANDDDLMNNICQHLDRSSAVNLRLACKKCRLLPTHLPLCMKLARKITEYSWLLYLFIYNARYYTELNLSFDFQTIPIRKGIFGDPFQEKKDVIKRRIYDNVYKLYTDRRKNIGILPRIHAIPRISVPINLIVPDADISNYVSLEACVFIYLTQSMKKDINAMLEL